MIEPVDSLEITVVASRCPGWSPVFPHVQRNAEHSGISHRRHKPTYAPEIWSSAPSPYCLGLNAGIASISHLFATNCSPLSYLLTYPAMAFGELYELLKVFLSLVRPQKAVRSKKVHVSNLHQLHGWRPEASRNK